MANCSSRQHVTLQGVQTGQDLPPLTDADWLIGRPTICGPLPKELTEKRKTNPVLLAVLSGTAGLFVGMLIRDGLQFLLA